MICSCPVERGQPGFRIDLGGVLDDFGARRARSARVLHRRLDVLDECAVAPDVQRLRAVADGEDGLAHTVRVLEKQLIDIVACRIRRGRAGMRRLAVLLRIDIGGRAGEQNAIATFGKLHGFRIGEVERDHDRLAAGAGHGVHIFGQSARGVLRIRVGNGNGNPRLHGVDGNAGRARRTILLTVPMSAPTWFLYISQRWVAIRDCNAQDWDAMSSGGKNDGGADLG